MDLKEQRPAKWLAHFLPIWTGQQLSLIGSRLVQFTLVWWVTETTGSATTLATATVVALLPTILLGPLVGALIDRWNRRTIIICADGLTALTAVWLGYLFWAGAVQIWHIYVVLLIRAIAEAFQWPSMLAVTSLMVPKEHLPRISGLNQIVEGGMGIICPVAAAFLISLLPMYSIMIVDVVTAVLAVVPLLLIAIPNLQPGATSPEEDENDSLLWSDVRKGLRYLVGWRGLLTLCLMAMLLNFLCGPAFYLTPVLVTNHFQGGAVQLGWADSVWAIGMVLGGLVLTVWGGFRRRIVTLLLAVIGAGIGFLIVALSPATEFTLALVGLFIVGFMSAISGGLFLVLIQQIVIPEMQGRVFTIFGSLVTGMLTLGMITAGPLADMLGVRVPYLVGGLAQVVVGLGGLLIPALMHLEAESPKPAYVEAG